MLRCPAAIPSPLHPCSCAHSSVRGGCRRKTVRELTAIPGRLPRVPLRCSQEVFLLLSVLRCSSGGPAGLQLEDTNPRGPWGWAAQFDVFATLFVLPSSEKSSCQHAMSPVQGSGRISQCWGCHHTGTAQQELWLRPAWRVVRERCHSTNPGEF